MGIDKDKQIKLLQAIKIGLESANKKLRLALEGKIGEQYDNDITMCGILARARIAELKTRIKELESL